MKKQKRKKLVNPVVIGEVKVEQHLTLSEIIDGLKRYGYVAIKSSAVQGFTATRYIAEPRTDEKYLEFLKDDLVEDIARMLQRSGILKFTQYVSEEVSDPRLRRKLIADIKVIMPSYLGEV